MDIQLNRYIKLSQAPYQPSLNQNQPSLIPNQPTWSPIRPMRPVQLYQTPNQVSDPKPILAGLEPLCSKGLCLLLTRPLQALSDPLNLLSQPQLNLLRPQSPSWSSETQNQLSQTPNQSSENLSQPCQTHSLPSKDPELLHDCIIMDLTQFRFLPKQLVLSGLNSALPSIHAVLSSQNSVKPDKWMEQSFPAFYRTATLLPPHLNITNIAVKQELLAIEHSSGNRGLYMEQDNYIIQIDAKLKVV